MAAIGDRTGEAHPPYIKVKKTYFEWREVKLVEEVDDDSRIPKFYNNEANSLKCFNSVAATAGLEIDLSFFPKLPMIPAEVALKVAKKPTTAWELFHYLCDYEEDKVTVVKSMLTKTKSGHSQRPANE